MRMTILASAALAIVFACPGASQTLVPDSVYAAPQQLVAIDGARRLNLYCVGSGRPAVVLEAGSGNGMVTWRFVQAEIGKTTRVCAYDRAGLGFSDAAKRPSDVANMADDLSRLIAAAGVPKPFVLVGHSLGGATAVLYAATHPDDLAGAVLVEPAFAGELHAMQAELPIGKRTAIADAMERSLAYKRACLGLAQAGKLEQPATEAERGCVDETYDPNRLDPPLREAGSRLLALPKVWEAMISKMASFVTQGDAPDADSAELDGVTLLLRPEAAHRLEPRRGGRRPWRSARRPAPGRGRMAGRTRRARHPFDAGRAHPRSRLSPLRADRRAASRDRRGAEGGGGSPGEVRALCPFRQAAAHRTDPTLIACELRIARPPQVRISWRTAPPFWPLFAS